MNAKGKAALARVAAWLGARSGVAAWGIALVLGGLLPLSFAPLHLLPVLFISVSGLIWLLDGAPHRRAAMAIGWWFGFGQFGVGLAWIAHAFTLRQGTNFAQGVVAVLALAAILGLFNGLALAVARHFWRPGRDRVVILAVAWTATEWLRGHLFTGFPWNLPGYGLGAHPALLQGAAYVGVYGLSLVALLLAAGPAAMVRQGGDAPRWRPLGWTALGLALLAGLGLARMAVHPTRHAEDLELLLIQANIPQDEKWQDQHLDRNLAVHATLTRQALAASTARKVAVLWPEAAVPYALNGQPGLRRQLGALLDRDGVLITGAPRLVEDEAGGIKVWNSLYALSREGDVLDQYDKIHLVPFGEYLPWRDGLQQIGVTRFVPSGIDFSAGVNRKPLANTTLPAFTPLICYEALFPGVVAKINRPQWLLNLSNDGWFGDGSGPHQHFAAAQMRAIEEGLPMVRATSTGISGVVDPVGRIIGLIGLNKTGILVSRLPLPLAAPTAYGIWNDWPVIIILVIIIYLVRQPVKDRITKHRLDA